MGDRAEDERRDAALIGRVVARDDHAAFAELLRIYQSAVRQFLRRLTGPDWSRADDLAQETFLKAYRHIATFRGRGRFLSWLFRIAYQEYVTELRRRHGSVPVRLSEDLPAQGDAERRFTDSRSLDQLLERLRPAARRRS